MPTSRKFDLPNLEEIKPSDAELAEISTESMAQSVAAFRSMMKRYEEAITAAEFDIRRLYFILGEVFSAWRVVDAKFKSEAREGKKPSLPYMEFVRLTEYVQRIQRSAVQKVARRYPYTSGPFVDQLREWVETLPKSEDKKRYLAETFGTRLAYDAMMVSPAGIPLAIRDFIDRSELATDAFESLWRLHGAGGPPGLPPTKENGGSDDGGGLGRRVSNLESAMEAMAKDMSAMAISVATIAESIKHLASREDVAKLAVPTSDALSHGYATKEDLTPIASDVSQIKERLRHVPTKFGLLMAVAIPVASGLWWIFQQIFTSAVS